ncbi:protoporphyrinogen oxidase [Polyangium fumosum]|uniref:Protoporphyrinogen oxidase n=1 Tax=Polyangium fumosum TaxID=889272 RepID=A0A4U1JKS8_9BACT|nr:protoporphyrinogen oxidase [Polyangium fumosum]TKD13255.1 protoporphyrinogen oxidase [Polyangium fumosum]
MTARRVVVVGGGVTGLVVAYRLLSAQKGPRCEVTLLESRARLGGNIQTEREGGFVIDGGPDSFVAAKPFATDLCKELGLGERLIGTTPKNRRVYIPRRGALHTMPEGLVLAVPTRFLPFARTPLFSLPGKARMALDLVLPQRPREKGDESIGSFLRRRLGAEALDVLGEPLLGGIYAGDVDLLSIRSTFPQLADLEDRYGSLIRGALAERRKKPATKGPPPSPFHSLLGGMGELIEALARRIEKAGGDIRVGAPVVSVERSSGAEANAPPRWVVRYGARDGQTESIEADDVVMAAPAHAAASALGEIDAELGALLRGIPYVSTGTVVLAYARPDVPHPLDAVGMVIPKDERRRILAATFISSKWAGRAPQDAALVRVFVGGHRDPGALASSDEALVSLAREELGSLLGIRAAPMLARVFRYEQANAQPIVGHAARVWRIRDIARRFPGLHFAGAAFDGVGIPDCVRQANEAAAAVAAR